MAWYIWLIFWMKHYWDLAFENYQNGKKFCRIKSRWPTSCLWVQFCWNDHISVTKNSQKYKTDNISWTTKWILTKCVPKWCIHSTLNVKTQCRCDIAFHGILVYGMMPLWSFFLWKSCLLYNFNTVQNIFMKLCTNIYHYQTICREPLLDQVQRKRTITPPTFFTELCPFEIFPMKIMSAL